jgi:hypothetical protein
MLVVQNSLLQHQSSEHTRARSRARTHAQCVSAHHHHLQNNVMQTGVQFGSVVQEEDLLHLPV